MKNFITQTLSRFYIYLYLNFFRVHKINKLTEIFAIALGNDTYHTHINLQRSNINFKEVKAITEALKKNKTLKSLNLAGNGLGDTGVTEIATALMVNTSLQILNLENNDIKDIGSRALGQALMVNTSLQILNLESNDIKDIGSRAFAQALMVNTSLQSLNIQRNNISFLGSIVLSIALEKNTTLKSFKLSDPGFSYMSLAESLKKNNTLLELDLGKDNYGKEALEALLEITRENPYINLKLEYRKYFYLVDFNEPTEEKLVNQIKERVKINNKNVDTIIKSAKDFVKNKNPYIRYRKKEEFNYDGFKNYKYFLKKLVKSITIISNASLNIVNISIGTMSILFGAILIYAKLKIRELYNFEKIAYPIAISAALYLTKADFKTSIKMAGAIGFGYISTNWARTLCKVLLFAYRKDITINKPSLFYNLFCLTGLFAVEYLIIKSLLNDASNYIDSNKIDKIPYFPISKFEFFKKAKNAMIAIGEEKYPDINWEEAYVQISKNVDETKMMQVFSASPNSLYLDKNSSFYKMQDIMPKIFEYLPNEELTAIISRGKNAPNNNLIGKGKLATDNVEQEMVGANIVI